MRPVFQNVVDLGLRDVGARNEPRSLAAHFGPRSLLLLALAVVLGVVPCAVLRQIGADAWVVAVFAFAWLITALAVCLRTVTRAPITVVKVNADGVNHVSWVLIASCALVALVALLLRELVLLPVVVMHAALAVAAWRGRRRVPDLLRRLREALAWDERVVGDGLGMLPGTRGPGSVRVVLATDRRVLVAASTEAFLVVDAPYEAVSRFAIEWKYRGRLGVFSLVVGGETHVVTSMSPANLLSIAQALQAHGVATDDAELVGEAERAWQEALARGKARSRPLARAAMATRDFDRGLWLLLALCAATFYLNPFGVGLGPARDGLPVLMLVPLLCAVCGYVSGTRSSLAYLAPLNLLIAPAFFFSDAAAVLGLMLAVSALATVGLYGGAALREATSTSAGAASRAARGTARHAVSGLGLIRISGVMLALIVGLAGATAAAGFELTDLRLAVQEATATKLPVDGRSNLSGGAASLTYTPGPGLRELVTDEKPLAGPNDGARWELRSSFTKGYNVITLGHYIVEPRLDSPGALTAFLAQKDLAHSRLAGRPVSHTRRVVDGRTGYVWNHGSPGGFWYYAAWFPQPVHSVRVECIARRQTARFRRLCAEAIGSLKFR